MTPMPFQDTTSAAFFEDRYRRVADPWNFVHSAYEQSRFMAIAAALNHRRYRRAFEPGCSIGTLTERLAGFCDQVDACDFSETAVSQARTRCDGLENVSFQCAALTAATPLAGYDLIVLSEIGYYFSTDDWRHLVSSMAAAMDHGTTILASHWLGHSEEHLQSGDQVHDTLKAEALLTVEHEERHAGFRLTRLLRP